MMRRWIVGVLTFLLVLSVVGWIVYIPPTVLQPLSAVPAHAHIVYQKDDPDWFLSFFPTVGEFQGRHSALWNKNFKKLADSPLVVATVSLSGREHRDTWVAVSALGARAIILRWQLTFFPPKNIQRLSSYGSWPVWHYEDEMLPKWMRVRFSIVDGMLVCAASEDSRDLLYLLDTLDGRRPSAE
ncbi:MAG: hypothetical protein FJ220_00735 [Kiritimatiellaceae bacterium]|nr:hypothetical protein [Kiritimatiellaceae bacterium]